MARDTIKIQKNREPLPLLDPSDSVIACPEYVVGKSPVKQPQSTGN
jgi:hypothetical protein